MTIQTSKSCCGTAFYIACFWIQNKQTFKAKFTEMQQNDDRHGRSHICERHTRACVLFGFRFIFGSIWMVQYTNIWWCLSMGLLLVKSKHCCFWSDLMWCKSSSCWFWWWIFCRRYASIDFLLIFFRLHSIWYWRDDPQGFGNQINSNQNSMLNSQLKIVDYFDMAPKYTIFFMDQPASTHDFMIQIC